MTLSAGVFVTLFIGKASAGCGDLNLQAPFQFPQQSAATRGTAPSAQAENASPRKLPSASIVGLWKVQLLSLGNTGHNPSIPDGALIDFGYTQWHSDGTEILNSGGHAPATGNFCLGVWGKTGFLTYELNHFPISYDATSGALTNYLNLREQDTLSPSGDSYSGTFTLDVYDTMGNHVDHLAGTVVATRLTVDSTLPSAAAGN
ncbi:MAG: hypothetical protein JOZ32_19705 [Bryobacterales bacterium]|nr:hypothetical protein [Bryobacterales bacterium]